MAVSLTKIPLFVCMKNQIQSSFQQINICIFRLVRSSFKFQKADYYLQFPYHTNQYYCENSGLWFRCIELHWISHLCRIHILLHIHMFIVHMCASMFSLFRVKYLVYIISFIRFSRRKSIKRFSWDKLSTHVHIRVYTYTVCVDVAYKNIAALTKRRRQGNIDCKISAHTNFFIRVCCRSNVHIVLIVLDKMKFIRIFRTLCNTILNTI